MRVCESVCVSHFLCYTCWCNLTLSMGPWQEDRWVWLYWESLPHSHATVSVWLNNNFSGIALSHPSNPPPTDRWPVQTHHHSHQSFHYLGTRHWLDSVKTYWFPLELYWIPCSSAVLWIVSSSYGFVWWGFLSANNFIFGHSKADLNLLQFKLTPSDIHDFILHSLLCHRASSHAACSSQDSDSTIQWAVLV